MLIRAGLLIDGTGAPPRRDRYIATQNGKITAIGGKNDFAVGQVELAVDYSQYCLLPGLIDCHVHLFLEGIVDVKTRAERWREGQEAMLSRAAGNLEMTLRKGVTTVRELGGPHGIAKVLKQAVERKRLPGPRVLTCQRAISRTGGHFHYAGGREADGPQEIAAAVREQIEAGADWVKLMVTGMVDFRTEEVGAAELSRVEIAAAVAEARRLGRPVSVHVNGSGAVRDALAAGVDTIEHGILADEKTVGLLAESQAYWAPTISPLWQILNYSREHSAAAFPEDGVTRVYNRHLRVVRQGVAAGAAIIAGTDAGALGVDHGEIWRELALFVAVGMSPLAAIQAATGKAAKAIGVDAATGTVEAGKAADLLVVRGNPLEDISMLRDVIQVYRDGINILANS